MDLKTYDDFVRGFTERMRAVTATKNPDYSAGETDAMANFKLIAQRAGVAPIQVWAVLWQKHVTAVERFVRHGQLADEPIEGRLIDMANYAMLGAALVYDMGQEAHRLMPSPLPRSEGSTVEERGKWEDDGGAVAEKHAEIKSPLEWAYNSRRDDNADALAAAVAAVITPLFTVVSARRVDGRPMTREQVESLTAFINKQSAGEVAASGEYVSCGNPTCPACARARALGLIS